jgi:AraC-like DNA-binding protein
MEATTMNMQPSSISSLPAMSLHLPSPTRIAPSPRATELPRPVARLPVSPLAPSEWAPIVDVLVKLGTSPVVPPPWWNTRARYHAAIETRTPSHCQHFDGGGTQEDTEDAALSFQLVLAGSARFELPGETPQVLGPGQGCFGGAIPQRPAPGSPGWTLLRIDIFHPYFKLRLAQHITIAGGVVQVRPNDALTSTAVRLVRGALVKDFRDQFDAELALFDFAVAFDRWRERAADGVREADRLMEDVRSRVLAQLPAAIEVGSLAAKLGMSRSYFSQLFRKTTGLTPAHFATEIRIQRVERLLLDTRDPLKSIAAACGFANANHLCKVFRRFRHATPAAFRNSRGHTRDGSLPG